MYATQWVAVLAIPPSLKKHYRSIRKKHRGPAKKWKFLYSFALMDLNTSMYIGYAFSPRSERGAYMKIIEMIEKMRIDLESIRLNRFYSGSTLYDFSENTRIFIIPKKNSIIRGFLRFSYYCRYSISATVRHGYSSPIMRNILKWLALIVIYHHSRYYQEEQGNFFTYHEQLNHIPSFHAGMCRTTKGRSYCRKFQCYWTFKFSLSWTVLLPE